MYSYIGIALHVLHCMFWIYTYVFKVLTKDASNVALKSPNIPILWPLLELQCYHETNSFKLRLLCEWSIRNIRCCLLLLSIFVLNGNLFAGILKLYEDILIKMDFIHLAQFLTRLPEQIQSEELFQSIDRVRMFIDTRGFKDVLAAHRDAILRENGAVS